jgi:hypothetical protein
LASFAARSRFISKPAWSAASAIFIWSYYKSARARERRNTSRPVDQSV